MYKLWIPVFNRKQTDEYKQRLVGELSRAKPDLVLLTYARIICDEEKKQREFEVYCENKEFLQKSGFTVGTWLAPTIGYGAPYYYDNGAPFTRIHKIGNKEEMIPGAFCPLDEGFVDEFLGVLKNIVASGSKTVLFEDDFTLSGGKTSFDRLGCCCLRHMKILRRKLGKDIKLEELNECLYAHGENDIRTAWFDVMGQTLRDFSKKIEQFVHSFDPDIRIGLSANASSFTAEGVGIDELARIVAGKNRPFIRLTGAPYWQNMPTYAANIEAERLQAAWCGNDIELIAEGDTFPRPRFTVSSSQLEIFDTALRADGNVDGILKYMIDYNSSPTYETGYIDRHIRNGELYMEIDKRFGSGKTEGLRIFENVGLARTVTFGKDHTIASFANYLPLVSQNYMCDCSIPTTYGDSEGAVLVFGENAKKITADMLDKGVILDAPAAKILLERGIDIGINGMEPISAPVAEIFPDYGEVTICGFDRDAVFYNIELKENAKVLSEFCLSQAGLGTIPPEGVDGCDRFPSCCTYENESGQRFMIYPFAAETVLTRSIWKYGLFRNYCRQRQLYDGIEWLQRKPLPAVCPKNPFLYMLCKRDNDRLTVGLWNIFSDEIAEPEIKLDKAYSKLDCFNCEGRLVDNNVILSGNIPPY